MSHPETPPPNEQRAAMAIGLAPILVLLTFTLILVGWIEPDTGIAALLSFAVWVAYEMRVYQRTLDRDYQEHAPRQLPWRSTPTGADAVRPPIDATPVRSRARTR
jgi:hypothetical protein